MAGHTCSKRTRLGCWTASFGRSCCLRVPRSAGVSARVTSARVCLISGVRGAIWLAAAFRTVPHCASSWMYSHTCFNPCKQCADCQPGFQGWASLCILRRRSQCRHVFRWRIAGSGNAGTLPSPCKHTGVKAGGLLGLRTCFGLSRVPIPSRLSFRKVP